MQVNNKIGFYLTGRRAPQGFASWLQELDAAGIPFFLVGDTARPGFLLAQEIARRNPGAAHTVIFRSLGAPGQPDYDRRPDAAAAEFWSAHRAALPESIDPATTWLELMDAPRTEIVWGDWLGDFAYELGRRVLDDGYRLAAFSFAVGTPDDAFWDREGILRYLALCREHPERLGVALREFSRKIDDIRFRFEDNIGRFQKLLAACERQRLTPPNIFITQWGWTPDRIPGSVNRSMEQVEEVAAFYARFPAVRGAALWQIGDADSLVGRQARRLIRPMTELALTRTFDLPGPTVLESGPAVPDFFVGMEVGEGGLPNARFISDVTIPDDSPIQAGRAYIKTWRVENNGSVAWKLGYRLVHVGGDPMTAQLSHALPETAPGRQLDVSIAMTAPAEPGIRHSDWRFQDDQGNLFGDFVFTRINVQAPPPDGAFSSSQFVADVTIPDDMAIAGGSPFKKVWRVRNNGTRPWGAGYTVNFVGGEPMTAVLSHPLPEAAPGQEVEVAIDMVAPTAFGVHYGDWRFKDAAGNPFGDMIYVRIVVPRPMGESLAPPMSQREPAWADTRLGHIGSPKTIGEWGCLLVCLAMTARALGENTDPLQLNNAMLLRDGFVDVYLTRFSALSQVYQHIVFEGWAASGPGILERIDASLQRGVPVPVQVDFTRDTPYTDLDQHWVLIVGRDGDDYRINDPWLLPAQEASLRERYGRAGASLQDIVMAAVFHRSAKAIAPQPPPVVEPPGARLLQRGMNVNPDAPHSNPYESDDLKGLDWVRFVFKLAARPDVAERDDINKAFAQYDPIIRRYDQIGVNSLVIINQETVWGIAPWTGNKDWRGYARQLAATAGQIAAHYRRYGSRVAYQIWNEGDKRNNPASVYVEPEDFAILLQETAAAIRAASPESPIIFNGMATGPEAAVEYLKRCRAALGGMLPVDAVGIHPYTRWATKAPFDWGKQYGTLGDAFAVYKKAFPAMKLWITEIGVADDNEIGPQFYAEIANYFRDIYQHVAERHLDQVPVVIWFAWSDWMRNAGIVRRDGAQKEHLFPAFRAARNREL